MQVTPDAPCTMLLLCPMLVRAEEDWSASVAGLPTVILACLLGATLIFSSWVANMTGRALLLTPSRGLGGGIERYLETLHWAFASQRIEYRGVDLQHAGAAGHARLLTKACKQIRAIAPTCLFVVHRSLLPAPCLLAHGDATHSMSVMCHGNDVWRARGRGRLSVENRLMRRPGVRIVAVSSFTADALADECLATALRPDLSREWFDTLVKARADAPACNAGSDTQLTTTFRLEQWRGKGLPEMLAAVAALGRVDIRVTVCRSGEPISPEVERLVRQHPYCTLQLRCTDRELADELAGADLFILTTRTRGGRVSSGKGFRLVLLEAQVAGTAVIGPAYGGSHDAYAGWVTGYAPTEKSATELVKVLEQLLRNPDQLAEMGRRATAWVRHSFARDRYALQGVARLP